ncbi:MAG TPA: glycosyltransferase [Candidatus Paceibacterota bacterium]
MQKKRALVMISTDRSIFQRYSQARARMVEYGELVDELHIIIFARKALGFAEMTLSSQVKIYPTASWSKAGYMSDALSSAKRILEGLPRELYDVALSAQDPFETGLVGRQLKKKFKLPLQIQVHVDFLSPFFRRGPVLNYVRIPLAKEVIKYADQVRVVSLRIARSLESLVEKKKIKILPIFVDIESGANHNGAEQSKIIFNRFSHVILMISRLAPEKNFACALEAFSRLLRTYPKALLVIVGSGPEKANIEYIAHDLGIARSVILTGWQGAVRPYYKKAKLFLSTSWYEGYGLALVEAAAAGIPIVTTNVGIVGDVLVDGESALVCDVNDADCLTIKMTTLIKDQELEQRLKTNAARALGKHLARNRKDFLMAHAELFKDLFNVTELASS